MQKKAENDPMLEVFLFETNQQLEQLEQSVLDTEAEGAYTENAINEIFRIMHTIKSSAAMMLFNNISKVAHSTEDLFYFIRENKPKNIDHSGLCDVVLNAIDFIKREVEKIKEDEPADGDEKEIIEETKKYLEVLKQGSDGQKEIKLKTSEEPAKKQFYIASDKSKKAGEYSIYNAEIFFEDGCEMENIRAFTIIHNLKDIGEELSYTPENIIDDNDSSEIIKKDGFSICFKTNKPQEEVDSFFSQVAFLKSIKLEKLEDEEQGAKPENELDRAIKIPQVNEQLKNKENASSGNHQAQNLISVNIQKLDKLMDLVGELVIAEDMVIQNSDLRGLKLHNFNKSARQLKKITSELQDTVMSIRMVPLGPTFFKMNRIVRDMSKKLNKEVHLDVIGEDTEVDKNIIEHIGDPLMHLVRNSLDHGIENAEERKETGKSNAGTITLEAKNAGSEVLIIIRDDGKGLDKDKILKKAQENEILIKAPEDMTDREIFNLIFLPGFSTKEAVTEYSGRGVGMDVVVKNIESVGGSIQVDSTKGIGTTITLKIPLTLAIINGMNIRVGKSTYTIPNTAIKESFRPKENDVFTDTEGNEMIIIRGTCYPILRLHKKFRVQTKVTNIHQGIVIMLESENKAVCIFADELIGEQQVVVKAMPNYMKNIKNIQGIAGCTLLGDGSISLILDVNGLIE